MTYRMSETVYNIEYVGYWSMFWHDKEDALRRWFDNWALNKYAPFVGQYEWLTIEEKSWFTPRGKKVWRYIGTIGADHHDLRRTVLFEIGAPPPPTFMVPIRQKYEPPLQESWRVAWQRKQQLRNYDEMIKQMVWKSLTPKERFVANVLPPVPPPPPRWRRN